MQEISIFLDCKHLDVVDIMHINVETPTHLSCSKTFKGDSNPKDKYVLSERAL